jgi:hypothetical protein
MTNIRANLKFYRRNRLLFVASLCILGMLGLSTIPSFFYFTKGKHLEIIKTVFSEFSSFATIITAGLGLLFISYHVRNRVTKMVFTKPCSPEVWLLSSLMSAAFVSFLFYAGLFALCSLLFLVWGIPFQWGIFYITANDFLQAIIALSYLSFLAVIFHPVIAVLFLFIFHESGLYYLKLLLASGTKASGEASLSSVLEAAKVLVDVMYMIVPSSKPFADKMNPVYSSLRISTEDWQYLALSLGYTLSVAALLYLLSLYFLKRRRHI